MGNKYSTRVWQESISMQHGYVPIWGAYVSRGSTMVFFASAFTRECAQAKADAWIVEQQRLTCEWLGVDSERTAEVAL